MPVVWIPPLLRNLSGGQESLVVPGSTVRELIDQLEMLCPGIKERLLQGGALRPGIAVVVDGAVSQRRLRHALTETSEVHFLPSISGG
jgi:molybdopterin converting factor small subunit